MDNKVMLGDFIYQLRKEKCLSQSELGQLVGVTNKAVSKWETYESNPDISIIKKLAEVLGVTANELLNCSKGESIHAHIDDNAVQFIGIKGIVDRTDKSFEFISDKKTKKGTPYLHINYGRNADGSLRRANGLVAIGIIAKGIIGIGIISYGLISIGIIAIGLLAVGAIGIGLLMAIGSVAVGIGVSIGGIAIGILTIGGVSIGVLSIGGVSIGGWTYSGINGTVIGLSTCLY